MNKHWELGLTDEIRNAAIEFIKAYDAIDQKKLHESESDVVKLTFVSPEAKGDALHLVRDLESACQSFVADEDDRITKLVSPIQYVLDQVDRMYGELRVAVSSSGNNPCEKSQVCKIESRVKQIRQLSSECASKRRFIKSLLGELPKGYKRVSGARKELFAKLVQLETQTDNLVNGLKETRQSLPEALRSSLWMNLNPLFFYSNSVGNSLPPFLRWWSACAQGRPGQLRSETKRTICMAVKVFLNQPVLEFAREIRDANFQPKIIPASAEIRELMQKCARLLKKVGVQAAHLDTSVPKELEVEVLNCSDRLLRFVEASLRPESHQTETVPSAKAATTTRHNMEEKQPVENERKLGEVAGKAKLGSEPESNAVGTNGPHLVTIEKDLSVTIADETPFGVTTAPNQSLLALYLLAGSTLDKTFATRDFVKLCFHGKGTPSKDFSNRMGAMLEYVPNLKWTGPYTAIKLEGIEFKCNALDQEIEEHLDNHKTPRRHRSS